MTRAFARPSRGRSTGMRWSASSIRTSVPATSIVPPGIDGSRHRGLQPPVRPGCGPPGARRRRVPRWRRVPARDPGDGWLGVRGRRARRSAAGAGHHADRGGDALRRVLRTGWTTTRPRCGAWAGARTIRIPTTSWACCWRPAAPATPAAGATPRSMPPWTPPRPPPTPPSRRPTTRDAQRIVQDQVPVIPLQYGESWALSRDGLLGASQSGMGIVRYAGLKWADR